MKATRILLILLGVMAIFGYAAWKGGRMGEPEVALVGFQAADEPFSLPVSGEIDPRFHFLSAWQSYSVPKFDRMTAPMGSENGALTYNAQKFWEMNAKRGGHHTGDDLNGIGGMNTDLGDPVYAACDGLVIYAGEPSPGWGKMVVLAHKDPKGQPLQTMYAHLDQIKTSVNAQIPRGQIIGTVGTANGYYPAHLHFEMRASDGVDIGAGYSAQPLNRIDPSATLRAYNSEKHLSLSPSIAAILKKSNPNPWTHLDLKNPEKLLNLEQSK